MQQRQGEAGAELWVSGAQDGVELAHSVRARHNTQPASSRVAEPGSYGALFCGHCCIGGLVVEYIVAIDVTRVRFRADACFVKSISEDWHRLSM